MILHETDNLILRSFTQADLEPFLGWRNDPQIARFQGWQVPYPREQGKQMIATLEKETPGTPGEWYQVALEHKELGQLIGDCAFKTAEDGIQAEIGYTLARQFHRRGYATEGVTGLIDYLFGTLNMHRVAAYCDTRNDPSWRLLERLGLRLEGHFIENYRDNGEWGSEYYYAILKREWREV